MVDEQTPAEAKFSPTHNRRVVMLVEYDGSSYFGSQYQVMDGRVYPTVQSVLRDAFDTLNIDCRAFHCSGRTDAGVHAHGQVVHVDLLEDNALQNIPDLATSLNAVLPGSISVKACVSGVSSQFNAQRDATHRWYRYRVLNRSQRSALMPASSMWVRGQLDAERMAHAAQTLVGTHNFRGFRCSDTDVENDICSVSYTTVQRQGDWVVFDIVANRFLYKMVRNLMGLLLAIGSDTNPTSPEVVTEVLACGDRTRFSWRTAPASGLSLMAVLYPPEHNYFHTDEHVQILQTLINMESKQDENLFRKAS